MRIKYFFKRYWRVICSSFICVAVLAMFVPCLAYASSAVSSDFLSSLGFGGFGDCVDNEGDIISSLTEAITGMTSDEVTAEYYNQYYEFLQGDWWGLANGSGGIYDTSTNNFNDSYLEAMGMQYAMFNTVRPFDWDAFVLYAKARRAAELAESGSFDSDSYFTNNPQDPIKISSSGLKKAASYWADYYKPMPTTSQYIFSYQSTESGSASPYGLPRNCPIYMDCNGGWGKKNWDEVYIMYFYHDDDSNVSYYTTNYCHFYSKRDDTGVYFCIDTYDLLKNELVSSTSKAFQTKYIYYSLGSFAQYKSTTVTACYQSYSDYMNCSGASTPHTVDFGKFVCYDYSTTTQYLYDLVRKSTFTPDTNKNDDWGFILSAEPFELFANQTSIDFEQIPDNYTITINGDTIYDYSITNPDTGDTETINYYITNNYTLPDNGDKGDNSDSSGSSGTTSGDVNVGGNVSVSGDVSVGGEISIKADPIDINVNTQPIDINVNVSGAGSLGSGSSEAAGVQFDEDVSLNNYYDWMNEQTSGFSGFMSQFFSWLPPDIVIMLCAGFACVILARFLGR